MCHPPHQISCLSLSYMDSWTDGDAGSIDGVAWQAGGAEGMKAPREGRGGGRMHLCRLGVLGVLVVLGSIPKLRTGWATIYDVYAYVAHVCSCAWHVSMPTASWVYVEQLVWLERC